MGSDQRYGKVSEVAIHIDPELEKIIEQCQTLIDILSDEIIFVDTQYTVVGFNKAKAQHFPDCRIGAKCHEVFERRSGPCPICAVREAMKTGQPVRHPERVQTENGVDIVGVRYVCDILATPMKNAKGEIIGCIEVVRDVSESYHQKRRLKHLTEEYKKVAYVLSHDLLAPLISIQGFVGKLEKKLHDALDDKGVHYFDRINSNITFMDRLIKSILDTSRIVNQELHLKQTDMTKLVRTVLEQFSLEIEGQDVRVEVSNNLPNAFCDPVRVGQVFANLMSNTLKFCKGIDSLTIVIGYEKDHYFFQDSGPGVPPDFADDIFKPFTRGDNAEIPGLGMGLSIVYEIIDKHDGTVWLDTEYTGGARFCFTLPLRNGNAD